MYVRLSSIVYTVNTVPATGAVVQCLRTEGPVATERERERGHLPNGTHDNYEIYGNSRWSGRDTNRLLLTQVASPVLGPGCRQPGYHPSRTAP